MFSTLLQSNYCSLDWSKLEVFAHEKFNVAQTMNPVFVSKEGIVGKREKAGYFSNNVFFNSLPDDKF